MPRYIRSIAYNPDFPDVPLVGHSVVHIDNVADSIDFDLKELEAELDNIANRAGEAFHSELATKAYVRRGSILLDIFFNCDLPSLLSIENLKALGVYMEDEIILGVKAGTSIYVTHLTFRAIKRLERGMYRICIMLKNYMMVRISAAKRIISNDKTDTMHKAEGRLGILGLLSRFYEAAGSCRGKTTVIKKRSALIRVRNVVNTFDDVIPDIEDRLFLCGLITPIIDTIPEKPVEKASTDIEREAREDYIRIRKQITDRLKNICFVNDGDGDE